MPADHGRSRPMRDRVYRAPTNHSVVLTAADQWELGISLLDRKTRILVSSDQQEG